MNPRHQEIGEALRHAETVIDVRAPAEFAKGAIANAVNIPLFDNAERSEIGVIYKHLGRNQAINRGLEFATSHLAAFVEAFQPYRGRRLLVYCARGGMRSASVVSLLGSLDFPVSQLYGGYKAFRGYLLRELDRLVPPRMVVLHGRTGVGKTLILNRLPNALDLEDLAQHRSSLFGAVNLRPRTQQNFEARLLEALQSLDHGEPVFVEGESRKVGDAIIPTGLMAAMKSGTCVLLTASLETRIRRIIDEYDRPDAETQAQLEGALSSLARLFGRRNTELLLAKLQAGDLPAVVRPLLEDYYDPRYGHGMRDYRYALELSAENIDETVQSLIEFWKTEHQRAPSTGPRMQKDALPQQKLACPVYL